MFIVLLLLILLIFSLNDEHPFFNPASQTCPLLSPEVERALAQGAALVISVSGGKDSDAMCQLLPELHRARGWTGPIALVHADLKDSEWSMTSGYVQHRAAELSLPLFIVSRKRGSLWEQMQQRHQQRPEVVVSSVTSEKKRIKIHKITN